MKKMTKLVAMVVTGVVGVALSASILPCVGLAMVAAAGMVSLMVAAQE